MLSYRLPREPSGPRTTLWRRLRRLGVAQIADGLVALPADARTREQLEWLAEDVVAASGTAGVWLARPTSEAQERELATTLAEARAAEYRVLTDACRAVLDGEDDAARALRRLRAEWRAVTRRDFFPPRERQEAAAALRELQALVAAGAAEPVR
jgi:hypothetical protein